MNSPITASQLLIKHSCFASFICGLVPFVFTFLVEASDTLQFSQFVELSYFILFLPLIGIILGVIGLFSNKRRDFAIAGIILGMLYYFLVPLFGLVSSFFSNHEVF